MSIQRALSHLTQAAQQRQQRLLDDVRDGLKNVGGKVVIDDESAVVIPAVRPQRAQDVVHDGLLLGADGLASPLTDLNTLRPVEPDNGVPAQEQVVLINGIMTDVELQQRDMQALANTGASVIGVHNATEGFFKDLFQCVQGKLEVGENAAVDSLSNVLAVMLRDERPVRIIGHSQGAILIANALNRLQAALDDAGVSQDDQQGLLSRIQIETYGGAAQRFIDGPSYHHVVNKADVVPMLTGVGLDRFNPLGHVGDKAVVHDFVEVNKVHDLPPLREGMSWKFARSVDRTVHGPADVYFKHRRAFLDDESKS